MLSSGGQPLKPKKKKTKRKKRIPKEFADELLEAEQAVKPDDDKGIVEKGFRMVIFLQLAGFVHQFNYMF